MRVNKLRLNLSETPIWLVGPELAMGRGYALTMDGIACSLNDYFRSLGFSPECSVAV